MTGETPASPQTARPGIRRWWMVLLLGCVLALLRYGGRLAPLVPEGCDEFGYLQLADAMARGVVLGEHVPRPFLPDLVGELRAERRFDEYAWMIAPHAYHLPPGSTRIINQYPPGTSFVLSLWPRPLRPILFPILVMLAWLGPPLIVLRLPGGATAPSPSALAVPVLLALLALLPPLASAIDSITSVGPTLGTLLAAGLCFARRPEWSVLLVSCTVPFRVANALLLAPLAVKAALQDPAFPKVLRVALFALPGPALVLAWQYAVTGHPLTPTYAAIDQAWAGLEDIGRNLVFYGYRAPRWLLAHVGAFALLWALRRRALVARRELGWLLALAAINYLFFITHQVAIWYYPYASAVIALGAALPRAEALAPVAWASRRLGVLVALAALGSLGALGLQVKRVLPLPGADRYRACLAGVDVVWAEQRSGTVEYAAGKAGFRWMWGSPEARRLALRHLHQRGTRQAIWTSDLPLPSGQAEREVAEAGLKAEPVRCAELGDFLVVR